MNVEVKKASVRKEKFYIFLWNFLLFDIPYLGFIFGFVSNFLHKTSIIDFGISFTFYFLFVLNNSRIEYLEKQIKNLLINKENENI